jgi:hypothetical protein
MIARHFGSFAIVFANGDIDYAVNLLPLTDTLMYGNSAALGLLSSLPSSEAVSSEESHTSHRHHPELSGRRLSGAQPGFGPLQKRSTAPFGIIYWAVTHNRTNFGQALKVVAVSLHDVSLAVGHRLYEVRPRQDHFCTRSKSSRVVFSTEHVSGLRDGLIVHPSSRAASSYRHCSSSCPRKLFAVMSCRRKGSPTIRCRAMLDRVQGRRASGTYCREASSAELKLGPWGW